MLRVAQCSQLDFELSSLLGGPGSQLKSVSQKSRPKVVAELLQAAKWVSSMAPQSDRVPFGNLQKWQFQITPQVNPAF